MMRVVSSAVAGIATGVALAGAVVSVASAGVGWSPPFEVTGPGSASNPQLVAGAGGRTTVFASSLESHSISMRVIRPDGSPGPDRQVTPSLEEGPYGWRAVGWAGGAVLVWPTADNALLGRRIDRRGRLGPVRQIAPQAPGYPEPSIGIDSRGNATIAVAKVTTESLEPRGWRTTSATIFVRRWHADGGLGPLTAVPAPAGELSRFPQLAVAPGGRTALAWWRGRDGGSGYAFLAATVERDGTVADVREVAPAARRWGPLAWDGSPKLAVADGGDLTVAWTAEDSHDLLTRRLAADGGLGAVERMGLGVEAFASPVVDRSGRVTIVSTSLRRAGLTSVRAHRLDAGGRPDRSWSLAEVEGYSSEPVAAVDRSGRVMALWSEHREGGSRPLTSVHGRRIGARGELGPPWTIGPPARGGSSDVALAIDGRGLATAAWSRWRGIRDRQILAARLVTACPAPRLRGALPGTGRRYYTGHVRGFFLRVRSKRAVDLAVPAGSISYRVAGGMAERVARLPRGAFATRGRDVRIVLPERLRAGLPVGARVKLRLRVRARPYATGCAYGPPRVLDVAARVGWVKP